MKTFTLDQLKEAWSTFEKEKVLRVLVGGRWVNKPLTDANRPISAVHAKVSNLCDVMDFPDYLETVWKKTL